MDTEKKNPGLASVSHFKLTMAAGVAANEKANRSAAGYIGTTGYDCTSSSTSKYYHIN